MKKVKLSMPDFKEDVDISQFTRDGSNVVNDCEFYINRDDVKRADYWFCFEGVRGEEEECAVNQSNVILLTAEVAWPRFYYDSVLKKNFLRQFGYIYTCHDIYSNRVHYDLPFLPWMINANHGSSIFEKSDRDYVFFKELQELEKPKLISVFCSTQAWTEGHRLRLKFVNELKNYFGDALDWFGNGVNQVERKWDGIAPYRYHIVLENQSRNNVITEKLYDSYLGLAYPIYYGAPNIDSYFNKKSYSTIDICDLNGSIKTIKNLIEADHYQESLPYIRDSKNLVLEKYNLFERLSAICNRLESHREFSTDIPTVVKLKPLKYFDVAQDLNALIRDHKYKAVYDRLLMYYPGHVLKKISDKLLKNYSDKYDLH